MAQGTANWCSKLSMIPVCYPGTPDLLLNWQETSTIMLHLLKETILKIYFINNDQFNRKYVNFKANGNKYLLPISKNKQYSHFE